MFGNSFAISYVPDAPRGGWGVGGVHHVAIGVADTTAQLKWKRRLMDHGVPVSGPYDRGWFTSIYFSDPDGQILEIATAGPGYDVDEPIDQLGETIVLPKPVQLRGQRDEAEIAARTFPEPVPEVTDDMRIDGLHHVTGLVNDIDAAGAFYTNTLGLALVKRSVNQDDPKTPHLFWANYDRRRVAKHSSITQFAWPSSTYVARAGAGQTHHISWRAGNAKELREWQTWLSEHGFAPTPILENERHEGLSFRAPDGLLTELTSE